jgi:dihydroorotase
MKDMPDVMSKLLNLDMPLQKVIEASTWKPAQVIQREDLGHMTEGVEADIVVFKLRSGKFGFIDGGRNLKKGDKKLDVELTIRSGSILWDLNGIASAEWDQ